MDPIITNRSEISSAALVGGLGLRRNDDVAELNLNSPKAPKDLARDIASARKENDSCLYAIKEALCASNFDLKDSQLNVIQRGYLEREGVLGVDGRFVDEFKNHFRLHTEKLPKVVK